MDENIDQLLKDAARNGDVNALERLYAQEKISNSYVFLSEAARHGHLECLRFLAPKCSNDEICTYGLTTTIVNNYFECTNYLLSLFTQPFDFREALRVAIYSGNSELVKYFIPFCDLKCGTSILTWAISVGNQKTFDLLLPLSDPKAEDSSALVRAVTENRREIFDILLPLSNPNADNGAAFREAIGLGRAHFVEVLYPLVDVQKAVEYVRDDQPYFYEEFCRKFYIMEAKMQKNMLNNNIGEQALKSQSGSRKM